MLNLTNHTARHKQKNKIRKGKEEITIETENSFKNKKLLCTNLCT